MTLEEIVNGMKPEEAARVRYLIRQFQRCRGALIEARKENEALKTRVSDLERRLAETEKRNQAWDKDRLEMVSRNRAGRGAEEVHRLV